MKKVYAFKNERFLVYSFIFSSPEEYKTKFCSLNQHSPKQISVLCFSEEDVKSIDLSLNSSFSRFEFKNGKMQLLSTQKIDVGSEVKDVVIAEFTPEKII